MHRRQRHELLDQPVTPRDSISALQGLTEPI
jgi:hypothetical protein